MNELTSYQEYKCEKCGFKGKVSHKGHADVMTVVYLIEDNHQKNSPECIEDMAMIRVINGIGKMK